jgi:hypothetical protein
LSGGASITDEEIYTKIHRQKNREYMKNRRDKTRQKKYGARTTRKITTGADREGKGP